MVDSNRIVSFDILKGGGILLVILGHIQIPYMLKTVIYSFHMPLFFFVSGCSTYIICRYILDRAQ